MTSWKRNTKGLGEIASPSELLANVDGAAAGDNMTEGLAAAATGVSCLGHRGVELFVRFWEEEEGGGEEGWGLVCLEEGWGEN